MKRPVSIYDGTMTDEDIDLMIATEDQDGLMSKEDKKKLNSLTTGGDGSATVDSLEASKVVQDATHRFVTDTQISTWDAKATTDKADSSKDGLMSKEDKAKLDGIAAEANKYEHPENHPATMITEDTDHKFVTDAEKAKWNAKADTTEVSTEANGLMSFADKVKLDGIATNANNYVHPENHEATMITEDETHRFVTDAEKEKWNALPADKTAIGLENVTNDAQVKRSEMGVADGVATLDSTGKVPSSQLPSFVDDVLEYDNFDGFPPEGESGKIYLAIDTNKTYRWSSSTYVEIPTSVALGETESTAYAGNKGKANADEIAKIKDGSTVVPKATDAATVSGHTVEVNVPADAKFTDTTYTHPDSHPATMITEDGDHKFVTDVEKAKWNAKAETTAATTEANGLMSKEDKKKLDGISAEANKYEHPANHPATMITEDETHKFVTDTEKSTWNAKADTTVASGEANGLMSSTDKTKLDGIEEGANKYVHPDTTEIRHVTDAEKAKWDAKADTTVVSGEANGLMSSTDKTKLDGIATNANNYVHPENHEATMITEDTDHRFVTDTEKAKWNAKADTTEASSDLAGLMSAADKKKLDGIAAEANKYEHPAKHEATIITEDETHRFVTDEEKGKWNAKAETTTATTEANGLMPKEDKKKLDGIEEGANKYVHPDNHEATMITEDTDHKFVTDTQIAKWDAKADTTVASGEANGLMSSTDKTKLDELVGVPTNFEMLRENNYINLKYGNPKELKAKFYIPKAQFSGSTCFIADELATFYDDLGGAPTSYDMKPWAEAGKTVEDLTAENGPYLVLTANYLGEDLGEESTLELEQYVTSLKPYFEAYMKSAEFNSKEFPELETTSKTIIGAINELKTAIDALKA